MDKPHAPGGAPNAPLPPLLDGSGTVQGTSQPAPLALAGTFRLATTGTLQTRHRLSRGAAR